MRENEVQEGKVHENKVEGAVQEDYVQGKVQCKVVCMQSGVQLPISTRLTGCLRPGGEFRLPAAIVPPPGLGRFGCTRWCVMCSGLQNNIKIENRIEII